MELWIRSQNKKVLMKVSTLEMLEDDNSIYTTYLDKVVRIGKYKTKERTLEVLDEIQNILMPKLKIVQTDDMSLPIMNGEWVKSIREKMEFDTIQLSTYVYEMPKE